MIKDEWITPQWLIETVGPFDLDPCAAKGMPWQTAAKSFTVDDNGLSKEWFGRVWCNPPYGRETGVWLERLAEHGSGVALIFARTETKLWFEHVWPKASAVRFIKGRLYFHHSDGRMASANAGAPSALVAYGENNIERIERVDGTTWTPPAPTEQPIGGEQS